MAKKIEWKKIVTNFVIPVGITAVIFYLFFRDISLTDIKENFFKIPLSFILAFIFLSLLGTVLRAYKYHILLSKKLEFKDVFLITLVRNFSVDLLPARTAALLFYSWLTKKKGIPLEEGASSFVVSVFYDALALSFMLGGLIFFLETGVNRWAIYAGMGMIFAISIVMIFFAETIIRLVLKLKLTGRFPKLGGTLEKIEVYLGRHKKNSERLLVFSLSLAVRVVKYVFIFILFQGVVHIGGGLSTFATFSFGLAGTEMSSLLPIQGLGGFGTWELAFSLIFKALEIPASNLKEAGILIHIITQAWEYLIGFAALFYLFIKTKSSHKDTKTQR